MIRFAFAFLLAIVCNTVKGENDPMVAFMCDRPSIYLTSSGWIEDETTGCLKDPSSILAFCQKVFPELDIRNVVESTHQVMINKWCNLGKTECNHRFSVFPYKCLAGPFQSEALLVPEGCIFDHVHDSKFCTTLIDWSQSSSRNCQGRGLVQNSFSVLQPCDVDRFQGVEFVCCPPVNTTDAPSTPSPFEKTISKTAFSEKIVETIRENENYFSSTVEGPLNDYLKVENFTRIKRWNEHESYRRAREDMERIHHEKIAKMMKDWGIARQRVQELKSIDPKASDKLNKEVTSRFQKTYESEELEAELEKKQLAELHEQRIQALLNEKKNIAMDKYINAIEDEQPKLMEIYQALDHYMKILQKERYHVLKKFQHVQGLSHANITEEKSKAIMYLDTIDKLVTKALDMLKQTPRFEAKVKAMITNNIISLHSMDNIIKDHEDSKKNISTRIPVTSFASIITKSTEYSSYSHDGDDNGDEYYGKDEFKAGHKKYVLLLAPNSTSKNSDGKIPEPNNDYTFRTDIKKNKLYSDGDELKENGMNVRNKTLLEHEKNRHVNNTANSSDDSDEIESSSIDDMKDAKEDESNDDTGDDDGFSDYFDKVQVTFNSVASEAKTTSSVNIVKHKKEGPDKTVKLQQNFTSHKIGNQGEVGVKLENANTDLFSVMPARFKQDLLHVKQLSIGKSGKEVKFSSAIPLGLTVGTVTVAIVIIAGVLVMRRRNNFRQHRMIPTEPMLVTSPEESHVMIMQVNGYENPTYKYFEINQN